MAGPIALAYALSRVARIRCPWCKFEKVVTRKPVAFRKCPRCHKTFPDPLKTKK
jgi:transposase-like protein